MCWLAEGGLEQQLKGTEVLLLRTLGAYSAAADCAVWGEGRWLKRMRRG